MKIESLPLAHARLTQQLLTQFLISCPGCAKPAAVHVDSTSNSELRVVRSVCPDACLVDPGTILAAVAAEVSLSA